VIDVDVGRIVPSTRDLFGALATRRKSLALVPLVESAAQLEALEDARAFAMPRADSAMLAAAGPETTTPMLLLAEASSELDCQRARTCGADGVVLADHALAKVAQSMRMMPIALGIAEGARACLLRGDLASVKRLASTAHATLLVADVDCDADGLRSLLGVVDAAIVRAQVHSSDGYRALVDAVDP
jgi:hypothetical protein